MKLAKAIEILTKYLPTNRWPPNVDLQDSMKLGIEALKQVKERRGYDPDFMFVKLPGETED